MNGISIRTLLLLTFAMAMFDNNLDAAESRDHQTRPVIRGRSYAVSSMRPESTQVAERILRQGGNAFDAAVAAQAVLSLVDAPNNGLGSDAMLLVYHAETARGPFHQRRRHGPASRHDRVVQHAQRRPDTGQRRTAVREPCPAWWTRGTCCWIGGAR